MDTREAYDGWAAQYDTNNNRTRDMEATALRNMLAGKKFREVLEIGCGTGKNTLWLQEIAASVLAVDLSEEMLNKAKAKIGNEKVTFLQADILGDWSFAKDKFDLVTFSLVLEHIEHLGPVIQKAANVLHPGGYVYIGELHPFKQYNGTKARFETPQGMQVVNCYDHHISDFIKSAVAAGLSVETIDEFFDDGDRNGLPRILALLLRKK